MEYMLPETNLIQIKEGKASNNAQTFVIEPLSPGYGITIGNSLRRILLSSLEGAALTSVRIEGVSHEFSTLKDGIQEDIVELMLRLKGVRVRLLEDQPTTLVLEAKGPKLVTAKDFKPNPALEIINKDHPLATLPKDGKLALEANVEKGRGYLGLEARRDQVLPVATLLLDSVFSPVVKVNFEVENTRVGQMTNFDKLALSIETDGTIDPKTALAQAARILVEHFDLLVQFGPSQASTARQQIALEEIASNKLKTRVKAKRRIKGEKVTGSEKS